MEVKRNVGEAYGGAFMYDSHLLDESDELNRMIRHGEIGVVLETQGVKFDGRRYWVTKLLSPAGVGWVTQSYLKKVE